MPASALVSGGPLPWVAWFCGGGCEPLARAGGGPAFQCSWASLTCGAWSSAALSMASRRPGSGAWVAIMCSRVTAAFMFWVFAGAGGRLAITLR